MAKKIRPAKETDVTAYLRRLFLKTEQELIREIMRKRSAGYVDYAEAAALERVQKILQDMVDDSWEYIPEMIETIFYHSDKDAAGYANARTLTAAQTDVVQQLSNNLLGEIMEMAGRPEKAWRLCLPSPDWKMIRSGGLPWNRSCARRRRAVRGSEAAGTW